MSWRTTAREKAGFLRSVGDLLSSGIDRVQRQVLAKVLALLRQLAQAEGRLLSVPLNENLAARLKREILQTIRESALVPTVQELLRQLDVTDEYNRRIYTELLGGFEVNTTPWKRLQAEEITDALTSPGVLVREFVNPIRRMVIAAIEGNMTTVEAEALLRELIQGDEQRLGRFRRYTGQVARDAVQQYDGRVNDLVRDAYQLDGFEYIGVDVRDSRAFCVQLRLGTDPVATGIPGDFADLAIGPGRYRVADIPLILERGGDWAGKNPLVTPATFATYRGGYNCQDTVVYFRISDL